MEAWFVFLIPISVILGGCSIAIVAISARARVREAQIRERIAMIERGLMPSPEQDPAAFDRVLGRQRVEARRNPGKWRRGGIVVTGVGLGMMVLFAVVGESEGIGIGGFLAIMGIAFFISSFVAVPETRPPFPYADPLPARPSPPSSTSSTDSR